jgi:hypothetical protein
MSRSLRSHLASNWRVVIASLRSHSFDLSGRLAAWRKLPSMLAAYHMSRPMPTASRGEHIAGICNLTYRILLTCEGSVRGAATAEVATGDLAPIRDRVTELEVTCVDFLGKLVACSKLGDNIFAESMDCT